jgi:hypothetical protein
MRADRSSTTEASWWCKPLFSTRTACTRSRCVAASSVYTCSVHAVVGREERGGEMMGGGGVCVCVFGGYDQVDAWQLP